MQFKTSYKIIFLLSLIIALTAVGVVFADQVTVSTTIPAICGNGDVDSGESCDGSNLNGQTCSTIGGGFNGGTLSCSGTCLSFITSGCTIGGGGEPPAPTAVCGNSVIETGEQCDAGSVNGVSCSASYGSSCSYCSTGCSTVNVQGGFCSDGIINGSEACDDGNLVSSDGCSNICTVEIPVPVCGNSIIEGIEQCDAGTLNGTACSPVYGGSCSYCSTGCNTTVVVGARCGDSIINGVEECDDGNGVVKDGCSPGCRIEVLEPPVCGNSKIEGVEQCDNGSGNNIPCVPSYGGSCSYCSGGCINITLSGGGCGDGMINGGEACDDGNLSAGDGCSPGCMVETTGEIPPGGDDEDTGDDEDVGGGEGTTGGGTTGGGTTETTTVIETVTEPITDMVEEVERIVENNEFIQNTIENVSQAVNNITESAQKQVKVFIKDVESVATTINEAIDNPVVERITESVVAPAIAVTAVAVVVPSLWAILFPFLRFLFLQPLLLLGRRKREGWGIVYNSLDKLPIDLAVVRLLDVKTHKVVQSRVTDKQGRYLFVVDPGVYQLQVVKNGFVFPSNLLKTAIADGRLVDIYHGEHVTVTEEKVNVTPNIPLDPIGVEKTLKRITREKRLRVVQHVVSFTGIILTLITLYISPTWYVGVFLLIHIAIYVVFVTKVKPTNPKGWGIVYDKSNKKPVGKVVARLFSKEFNKLVTSQLTNSAGRYAFLVGPSDYYVTFEKDGYQTHKSRDIDVKQEKVPLIKEDVGLEKKNEDETNESVKK